MKYGGFLFIGKYPRIILSVTLSLHGIPGMAASARETMEQFIQQGPQERTGLAYYKNCGSLREDLQSSMNEMWLQEKAWISAAIDQDHPLYPSLGKGLDSVAAAEAVNAGVEGATNVQELGVDEADRFRMGDDQLFVLSSDEFIQVLDRRILQRLGRIHLKGFTKTQMLTAPGRLIIVGESGSVSGSEMTSVRTYATAAHAMPRIIQERRYQGRISTTRLLGDKLLLVLQDQLPEISVPVSWRSFQTESWFTDPVKRQKLFAMASQLQRRVLAPMVAGQLRGIDCQRYVQRSVRDWDIQLTKTLLLNIQSQNGFDEDRSTVLGSIGSADELYVTTHHLYILKQQLQWFTPYGWWGGKGISSIRPTADRLRIQQLSLEQGFLQPRASGQLPGRIKDRWSIRELKEGRFLSIATTTGYVGGVGGDTALNHLFIVAANDQDRLQKVASIENFAPREDIRSVRYIGDYAYIVTFEKTDPLFAFDLTDPEHPVMLSELKIPGFSTYMHPLGGGRLLGVGFDALDMGQYSLFQGVKISLFEISDPTFISELQSPMIYGVRGSSSEVATDPKAFFFDSKTGRVGIPLIALRGIENGQLIREFSGAVLLALQGLEMKEVARFSHVEWIPESCRGDLNSWRWWQDDRPSLDINRLYQLGDQLVTLSRWGIKAYQENSWEKPSQALYFPKDEVSCY